MTKKKVPFSPMFVTSEKPVKKANVFNRHGEPIHNAYILDGGKDKMKFVRVNFYLLDEARLSYAEYKLVTTIGRRILEKSENMFHLTYNVFKVNGGDLTYISYNKAIKGIIEKCIIRKNEELKDYYEINSNIMYFGSREELVREKIKNSYLNKAGGYSVR